MLIIAITLILKCLLVGVLALSYYPVGMADDEGKPMFGLIRTIMDVAQMYGIKVEFRII